MGRQREQYDTKVKEEYMIRLTELEKMYPSVNPLTEQIVKDRRKDLHKYYKYVLVCKGCKKRYGIMEKNDRTKLCPVCLSKIWYKSKNPKRLRES